MNVYENQISSAQSTAIFDAYKTISKNKSHALQKLQCVGSKYIDSITINKKTKVVYSMLCQSTHYMQLEMHHSSCY